jgi:hypothetical protein
MRLSRTILNTPRLRHTAALELLSVRAQGYRFQGAYSRRAMYARCCAVVGGRSIEAYRAGMLADCDELDTVSDAFWECSL